MMREAVSPERLAALLDGRETPRSAEERALLALALDVRKLEGPAPESLRTRLQALVDQSEHEAPVPSLRGRLASMWAAGGARRRTMIAAPIGAIAAAALAAALLIPGGSPSPITPTNTLKATAPEASGGGARAGGPAFQAATTPPAPAPPRSAAAPGLDRANILPAPTADTSRPQDIRTWTRVHVDGVQALSKASRQAMAIVHDLGGFLASTHYSVPNAGEGENLLVFKVPPAREEAALRGFATLGTVIGQRATTVDLGRRLDSGARTLRRLLARVRNLRAQAARNPGDADLARRLAAAEAAYRAASDRQGAVLDRTRMATMTLTLTTVGPKAKHGQFVGALFRAGGRLAGGAAWVMQALILVLPPLLVIGAALAAWHLRRRRVRRRLLEAS